MRGVSGVAGRGCFCLPCALWLWQERCFPYRNAQAHGQADFVHDAIARIDAKAAGDALHLQSVADVNSHRAYGHAQVAIDTVAASVPRLSLFMGRARFSAFRVITDDERIPVEHARLETSIRAHVSADLFARKTRHDEGRSGQRKRPYIDAGRYGQGKDLFGQGWRIVKIENKGSACQKANENQDR